MRAAARLFAFLVLTAPAVAQVTPNVDSDQVQSRTPAAKDVTQANQLLNTIMSPLCPGLTLANCPSPNAEVLRAEVRSRVEAGESPEAIVESLVAAYGEGIRGAPRARGLGLALWVLPFLLLAAGGIGVVWWLRARGVRVAAQGASSDVTPPRSALSAEDRAALDAELRLVD